MFAASEHAAVASGRQFSTALVLVCAYIHHPPLGLRSHALSLDASATACSMTILQLPKLRLLRVDTMHVTSSSAASTAVAVHMGSLPWLGSHSSCPVSSSLRAAAAPVALAIQAAPVQVHHAVSTASAKSALSMTAGQLRQQEQQQCVAAYAAIAVPLAAARIRGRVLVQLLKALKTGCTAMAVYSPSDVCAADAIAAAWQPIAIAGQGSSNASKLPGPTALVLRKGHVLHIRWAGSRQSFPYHFVAVHSFRVQSKTSAQVREHASSLML